MAGVIVANAHGIGQHLIDAGQDIQAMAAANNNALQPPWVAQMLAGQQQIQNTLANLHGTVVALQDGQRQLELRFLQA
jgi:hypothetical protein